MAGDKFYYGKFPDGFAFGVATASYQIEGGYKKDGEFFIQRLCFGFLALIDETIFSVKRFGGCSTAHVQCGISVGNNKIVVRSTASIGDTIITYYASYAIRDRIFLYR